MDNLGVLVGKFQCHSTMRRVLFGRWEKECLSGSYLLLATVCTSFLMHVHPPFIFLALQTSYVVGATLTQNCFLAIHEITHNLAFKVSQKSRSKLLAIFANLPIGIPYSSKFPGYHMEHHRYQGVDGIDTDIPHPAEAWLFDNLGFFGRLFFAVFQILFYAIRPMAVRDQAVDFWFGLNFAIQFAFDGLVVYKFGMGPIWYLLMSAFFSGSLHPMASHFVAEHYVFLEKVETYSYYGWLNLLTFNVGYHNEHHDFPYVAWDKLPLVREVAAKHYDNLPYHRSWPLVLWKFLTMDTMSSYSRVKRKDEKSLAKNTVCKPK
jgi:sphingolipid delta-4 desaturase